MGDSLMLQAPSGLQLQESNDSIKLLKQVHWDDPLHEFSEERQFKQTDGNLVENEVLLIQNMQLQSEIQTLEISKANLQRNFNKLVRKKLRDRRFGSMRTNSVRS